MAAVAKRKPAKKLAEMTKAEARAAIAKDVLKSLKSLRVRAGSYCTTDSARWSPKDVPASDQIQKHLPKVVKNCQVCALGACLLSHAKLFNHSTMAVLSPSPHVFADPERFREGLTDILNEYFDDDQLNLIEMAFEGTTHGLFPLSVEDRRRCEEFAAKHPDDRKRLRAIMLNMAKNKGDFKP